MKAAKCDEWVLKNPQALSKMKDCNALSTCPAYMQIADYAASCRDGITGSFSDLLVDVVSFVTTNSKKSPDLVSREEYFNRCTTSFCKRKLLGPYVGLFKPEEIDGHGNAKNGGSKYLDPKDPLNKNYIEGKSAAVLYRELLGKLKSRLENSNLEKPFIDPWTGAEIKIKKKKSINDMIDSALESMGIKNTACYDPAVLAEMRCYAFITIVDPYVLAKVAPVIGRLAGLAGNSLKTGEALSKLQVVKAGEAVKGAENAVLKSASNESTVKSRAALIEDLESKKKSLSSTQNLATAEKEIPAKKDLSELNLDLDLNQQKIASLEKQGSDLSWPQKRELEYLKAEKSMYEAKLNYQTSINKYHSDSEKMVAELENFPKGASTEQGAVMNTKIHELNSQLSDAAELEIKMIKEENKLLKMKSQESEIINLNLHADQRINQAEQIALRGQEDKAIFDMALASRKEYQSSVAGLDTKAATAEKSEAQKRLKEVRQKVEQNIKQNEQLKARALKLVENDVSALSRLKAVVQGTQKPPPGVTYDGYIYRSGPPEIHGGNLAANHRYSAPGQGLLYTSESSQAVAAELKHYGIDPSKAAPINSYKVKVENVLDLTDAKTRQSLGLDLSSLMRNDYLVTHSLGEVARELGYKGVIAPSARDPSGRHILLFDEVTVPKK